MTEFRNMTTTFLKRALDLQNNSRVNLAEGQAFRPFGINIIAILMILFGFAELVTGFTHNFFGISTTPGLVRRIARSRTANLIV